MNFRFLLYIVFAMFFCLSCHAQNFAEDFKKISMSLVNNSFYKMNIDYLLYKDKDLSVPYQERHSVFIIDKKKVYYKQEDSEFMINDKYFVSIDYKNKQIYVSKKDSKDGHPKVNNNPMGNLFSKIDSLSKLILKSNFVKMSEDQVMYELTFSSGIYNSMKIVFNPKDYLVSETEYVFREPKTLNKDSKKHFLTFKVLYKNYDLKTQPNSEVFNHSKYFSEDKKGQYIPKGKFSNYNIIN